MTTRLAITRGFGVAVALAILSARPVRADDSQHDDDVDAPRTLDGHQFVPSSLVLWGFIDSTFAMTSSAGYVRDDIDPPAAVLGGRTLREVRLIALAHTISGAAELTPWLGLTARVTGSAEVPKDLASVILVGAHENLGFEAGPAVRLVRTPILQVTARGDFGLAYDKLVQPMPASGSLLTTGDIITLRPAVIGMLALSQMFGLQASVSYAWQWFDITTNDRVETLDGALAGTMALGVVPITLLGGGQINHEWGRDVDTNAMEALLGEGTTQWRVEGGVFYTGRRDLDLGASVTYQFSSGDDRRWLGNARFGYYF